MFPSLKTQKNKQLGLLLTISVFCFSLLGQAIFVNAQGPLDYKKTWPPTGGSEQNLDFALQSREVATTTSNVPCEAGFAGDYPCNNIDLLSHIPLSDLSGSVSGADIWGWTDPETKQEYALFGVSGGVTIIDLTDPINPVYIGLLPTHAPNDGGQSWRDIKVYADHMYNVSEINEYGLQIFDLTSLRTLTGTGIIPLELEETAHFDGFGSAHNIVINEETGYAYAVGANECSGGLYMMNIQDPVNPTFAGCFDADGYTHDAQCVIYNGPDTTYQNQEVCFNANEDTVTIVDVTDKANPVQLSKVGYAGSAYTHQGWLTEDHTYFISNDELDEQTNGHNTYTYIWDVSDLDGPTLIGIYVADVPSIDHNLYTLDNYVYAANYQSGLRILSLNDVANGNLAEVAYFDIAPETDSASFDGAWSNYPYFESGNIIISGISQGFFVVRPTSGISLQVEETDIAMCVPNNYAVNLNLDSIFGYTSTVQLSTTALPTGITADFGLNPLSPNNTTVMTLTVADPVVGMYNFAVVANGSNPVVTEMQSMTLHTFSGTPNAPALMIPANGAAITTTGRPALSWNEDDNTGNYIIEIATDDAFANIIDQNSGLVSATYQPPLGVVGNGTYYWRVRSENLCDTGANSAVYSFTHTLVDTLYVTNSGNNTQDCASTSTACQTLDEALAKSADGTTIMVAAGTYSHTVVDKNVTIIGTTANGSMVNPETNASIIDGDHKDRGLTINQEVSATIKNITILNGLGERFGGGIFVGGHSEVMLAGIVINNSTAVDPGNWTGGGGIYVSDSADITLMNTHIISNHAQFGAGIFLNATGTGNGSVTAMNSLLDENNASSSGGAIYNWSGTVTLSQTTLSNNQSGSSAGGIMSSGATTSIVDSNIVSNQAIRGGGAYASGPSFEVKRTVFANNQSETIGGGLYLNGGSSMLENVTVSGNQATELGGGLYVNGDSILNNATVAFNEAITGGGLFIADAPYTTTLKNTLVASNIATSGPDCEAEGLLQSMGYNLIGIETNCTNTANGTFIPDTSDQVGTAAAPINPLLGPLADNGGHSMTHALLSGSPALDAANPDTPGSSANSCATTDQRWITRPVDGNNDGTATCDVGAYEYEAANRIYLPVIMKSQ